MTTQDPFAGLAWYYDSIMNHIDYEHWRQAVTRIGQLLRPGFRHLEAACGTGTLLESLLKEGWRSTGLDLSIDMLRSGRKNRPSLPFIQGDLRAIPFHGSFGLVTCLFDSMNFLLEEEDMRTAIAQCADALEPGGILYFDVITEKMVLDFFSGQKWTEDNVNFRSAWTSSYDRRTRLSVTHVRVNKGPAYTVTERVYAIEEIEAAIASAGLTLLARLDASTWAEPRKRSLRLDLIAVKGDTNTYRKPFEGVLTTMRGLMAK